MEKRGWERKRGLIDWESKGKRGVRCWRREKARRRSWWRKERAEESVEAGRKGRKASGKRRNARAASKATIYGEEENRGDVVGVAKTFDKEVKKRGAKFRWQYFRSLSTNKLILIAPCAILSSRKNNGGKHGNDKAENMGNNG